MRRAERCAWQTLRRHHADVRDVHLRTLLDTSTNALIRGYRRQRHAAR